MKKYIVYKHLNKMNGKVYVGVTNDVDRRWRSSGIEYKPPKNEIQHHRSFWNAIQKYGWENFDHLIIEENLTMEEAFEKEKFYIELYDSTNKEKGYNIAKGGNGGIVYKVHPKGMLGKKQSKDFCLTHSEWAKNHNNNCMTNGDVVWGVTHEHPKGMLGKHHSKESIMKKKAYSGENAVTSKPIVAIERDGTKREFHSAKLCMAYYSISTCVFYRILREGTPYVINPKVNYRNKEKILAIEGIMFKHKEDTEVS